MKNAAVLGALVACGAIALAGCGKKDQGTAGAGSAAASGSAATGAGAVGLNAPGNNPVIVEAAKPLLAACAAKWASSDAFRSCDELNTYREGIRKLESGKDDKTFIAFLEDPDEKVRYLGLDGIHSRGSAYKTDPDLAARLVTALEKEKCPALDGEMAYFAAQIDLAKVPSLAERIKKLALADGTSNDIKAFIAGWWLNETKADIAYDTGKQLAATATDSKVKSAALQGLNPGFDKHADEVCKIWFDNVPSPDDNVAAAAAGLVTGGAAGTATSDRDSHWSASGGGWGREDNDKQCSQVDATLDALVARAKAGKISDSSFVYAASGVVGSKKASAATKKKAVAVLQATVETKANSSWNRYTALRQLWTKDPSYWSYVQKFAKDPDLKDSVAQLQKEKDEQDKSKAKKK